MSKDDQHLFSQEVPHLDTRSFHFHDSGGRTFRKFDSGLWRAGQTTYTLSSLLEL